MSAKILEAIAVAAEMTGTELSKPAMRVIELELEAFPEDQVLAALARCRRELRHRMTLADILERLQGSDGRPSGDEAWAKALAGMDESTTVVTNDEIAEAAATAKAIYDAGDKVGARMAFREAYERIVQRNRENRVPVRWWASLGQDPHGREAAIRDGVERGLLGNEALKLLPGKIENGGKQILALLPHAKSPDIGEKLRALRNELHQASKVRKALR